ncbi:MAG TPA: hypothetical protein VN666_16665 [Nitrospira sp.]|nr:hypothetical protein [Nitrospira sp.]
MSMVSRTYRPGQCMAFGWFHQFTYGRLWTLLKDTVAAWSEGKVPRYDATLAYVK